MKNHEQLSKTFLDIEGYCYKGRGRGTKIKERERKFSRLISIVGARNRTIIVSLQMMIQRSVVGFVCFTTIRGDRTDDIINGWNKRGRIMPGSLGWKTLRRTFCARGNVTHRFHEEEVESEDERESNQRPRTAAIHNVTRCSGKQK